MKLGRFQASTETKRAECRAASAAKNDAYKRTLHLATMRAIVEDYRQKRREERRLIRYQKRELERREREEIEMYRSRNDAQKRSNLVTDAKGVLRLWGHRFSTLLRGEGDINAANGEDSEPAPNDDNGVEIPPPSHNDVRVAIQRLKNNKTVWPDLLPAEVFKAGGNELVRSMHRLICIIWLEESMPSDWNISTLKNGDPTIYANYRGISLLPIAYKVRTSVLYQILKPHAKALIGPYQCGF